MIRSALTLLLLVVLFSPASVAQTPDLYDETVLRTVELTFSQSDWWQQLTANYASETYLQADMTVEGTSYPGVGVRFKGNSSYNSVGNSDKKPFNIDVDAFNPGQELLGYKKLILNNGYKDPTFCREVLSYHVMRSYLPAPKANWLKLVINGQNWGIYVNIQHMGGDFMGEWFEDDDGNRYKANPGSGSALTWQGSSPGPYQGPYELKSDPSPTSWTDLINLCDVLNNTPTNQLVSALDPIFSIERALWMVATTNVLCQGDAYFGTGHNYYVFHDDHHDRMHTLPWDLNSSFGAFSVMNLSHQQKINLSPFYNSTHPNRPLLSELMGISSVRSTYLAHVRTLLDEQFDWNVMGPLVSQFQGLIDAEVSADTKKLYSYALFQQNVTQDVNLPFGSPGSGALVPGLQPFVTARRAYLLSHSEVALPAPDIQSVSLTPSSPTAIDTVWVTTTVSGLVAPVGTVSLYWRVLGPFVRATMFDDGQHNDGAAGDGTWGASIASQIAGTRVAYYVRATSVPGQGGAKTLSPRSPEHTPLTYVVQAGATPANTVKVNEFIAKNDAGITDEAGEFEDWVELVNVTAGAIDVSSMYLTDDLTNLTKWQIPAGNVLSSGDTLLIWCDEDGSDGPLHASFKLSSSGEEIAVVDTDGTTVLDHVTFGAQAGDISTGRLFDGVDPQVTFSTPTPDALNAPVGCGTRSYSALDSLTQALTLSVSAPLTVGASVTFSVSGGPPSTAHYAVLAAQPGYATLFGTSAVLLVDPAFTMLPMQSDASGTVYYPVTLPNVAALAGAVYYVQVGTIVGGVLQGSNALELVVCP
ncbi:MAG: CotH kinase family protein [Planctomycetes bacterium]|nr:CotH kinase family protein [Planctomycetota bacterium]